MRRTIYIHDAGCTCRTCTPRFVRSWRRNLAIEAIGRVLLLLAALISIPFLIARAVASMKETR